MDIFNIILTRLTGLLLAPLSRWPLAALLFYAVITGLEMAIVFRFTSNQRAIRRAVDGSGAEVLAIKLFQDDVWGIFKSLGRLQRHSGARLLHSLPPALIMFIPFVVILVQLAQRYDRRPLMSGESAIVQLQLDEESWNESQHAELLLPEKVSLQAGPLRDFDEHALYWRIAADTSLSTNDGPQILRWKIGSDVSEKRLAISADSHSLQLVRARRAGQGWLDRVLNPGEPGLPRNGSVRGIEVGYPERCTPLLGWNIPWWATFVVVSMLAAYWMRPWIGVVF